MARKSIIDSTGYSGMQDAEDNFIELYQSVGSHTHGEEGDTIVFQIVANEAALPTGTTDGEMAICNASGNRYWWDDDNSKWAVFNGNAYATGSLPAAATYTIETGIIVIDTTTDQVKRYTGSAWETLAASMERAGDNEIDGDHLDIDYSPSNYTPSTTPDEADNADDLAAHLAGVDNQIGTINTTVSGKLTASSNLSDVGTAATAFGNIKQAATDSATGVVELATTAEVNTGTDAARAITPDALAGANIGIRYLQAKVFDWGDNNATGNGKHYFHVPPGLNGMNLVYCHALTIAAGTTGTETIMIHNLTQTADMLSTVISIDDGETGSDTAATPYVIDTSEDDVATNDVIRVDVDSVHTTPATGLVVTLGFQLP